MRFDYRGMGDSSGEMRTFSDIDPDIASAVDVPVSADFEHGFAADPNGVAANVARVAATGVAGVSIEDGTSDHVVLADAFGHGQLGERSFLGLGQPDVERHTRMVPVWHHTLWVYACIGRRQTDVGREWV